MSCMENIEPSMVANYKIQLGIKLKTYFLHPYVDICHGVWELVDRESQSLCILLRLAVSRGSGASQIVGSGGSRPAGSAWKQEGTWDHSHGQGDCGYRVVVTVEIFLFLSLHEFGWVQQVAAPKMALKVLDMAMQVHGGAGLSSDTVLAHLWATARTLRIADGPDEVHLGTIARLELGRAKL